jgi:hypothetical protein
VRCASSARISGKVHRRLSSSSHSVERRCHRQAFPVWSSGQPRRRIWASRLMRISFAMPAGISSPTMAVSDPGLSRPSQYSEYDALYRAGAAAVQGVFSRLKGAVNAKLQCNTSNDRSDGHNPFDNLDIILLISQSVHRGPTDCWPNPSGLVTTLLPAERYDRISL